MVKNLSKQNRRRPTKYSAVAMVDCLAVCKAVRKDLRFPPIQEASRSPLYNQGEKIVHRVIYKAPFRSLHLAALGAYCHANSPLQPGILLFKPNASQHDTEEHANLALMSRATDVRKVSSRPARYDYPVAAAQSICNPRGLAEAVCGVIGFGHCILRDLTQTSQSINLFPDASIRHRSRWLRC